VYYHPQLNFSVTEFNIKLTYLLYMLIVKVQENKGGIEKALKQLKSKVIKTRQMTDIQDRKEHIKNSVRKREKKKKAIYVQKKFKIKD
jgi:ribosomal protein S21